MGVTRKYQAQITQLREENAELRDQLAALRGRVLELEAAHEEMERELNLDMGPDADFGGNESG